MADRHTTTHFDDGDEPRIRRLNKLPVILFVAVVVVFILLVVWGLSQRELNLRSGEDEGARSPAVNFADVLKRGIGDGIIETPGGAEPVPTEPRLDRPDAGRPGRPPQAAGEDKADEKELDWREQMELDFEKQLLALKQQKLLASLQADGQAYASSITAVENTGTLPHSGASDFNPSGAVPDSSMVPSGFDGLSSAAGKIGKALGAQLGLGEEDYSQLNGQEGKKAFFNQTASGSGYLGNQVVPQQSPFELKRGSVVPAIMISGINSDLPGNISAQVSQNVYDSATGHHLLIPQGTKLFGQYDSDVTFGQQRVLVVWTDIIFPNGSTLRIDGMGGYDVEGYSGFKDKVNNHNLRTFGSAVLLSLIGAGIDLALPDDTSTYEILPSGRIVSSYDSMAVLREGLADNLGTALEQTFKKNLNIQPTLTIRPGYRFSVMVEKDIVFPRAYRLGE